MIKIRSGVVVVLSSRRLHEYHSSWFSFKFHTYAITQATIDELSNPSDSGICSWKISLSPLIPYYMLSILQKKKINYLAEVSE